MGSFSTYKTLEKAQTHFNIAAVLQAIFSIDKQAPIIPSAYLVEELAFNMTETPYKTSEAAICEAIIFPIIKEVWKSFTADLQLWSHKSLSQTAKKSGIPDYIIAKRSALGNSVLDLPMLVMIEAKKDDFDEGWGQCLAQMYFAQQLSKGQYTVYGVVSNGDVWEFGYLSQNTLTRNDFSITIKDLQGIFNILYQIFSACQQQIRTQ